MQNLHTSQAVQLAIDESIKKELAKWHDPNSTLDQKAYALAALSILLGQLDENAQTPQALRDLLPELIQVLQKRPDTHVVKNGLALLSGLLSTDEPSWNAAVLKDNTLVPLLVDLLVDSGSDQALAINVLAALTAVAQGGEPGAQLVVNAQGVPPILAACSPTDEAAQLQEAAADALCQMSTYESCRPLLSEQHTVEALSGLLGVDSVEVRVRALMGLAMLLPSSPANQQSFASDAQAVRMLLANVQQDDDKDCKSVAQDLFKLLASNPACKEQIAAALRAAAAAAGAAGAARGKSS